MKTGSCVVISIDIKPKSDRDKDCRQRRTEVKHAWRAVYAATGATLAVLLNVTATRQLGQLEPSARSDK